MSLERACSDGYDRNDAKTVNVIAEACFSPVNKIAVTAIRFFLNTNEDEEEDESEEEVLLYPWHEMDHTYNKYLDLVA